MGYIATLIMGIVLGLLGGGGSILTVPVLVYLFETPPLTSTAYSLFIVGITALIGGLQYWKNKSIDFKVGFLFAVPSFIGVYFTRAYIIPSLPDVLFAFGNFEITKSILIMVTFSILMIAASFSMLKTQKQAQKIEISPNKRNFIILLEGLLVGSFTGFVGAGGGFLIIPALVILIGLPMKIAVGTSLFIIAIKSLIGFTGDLQAGLEMNWKFLLILSSLSILGMIIGVRLAQIIPDKYLKKSFGIFVLLMGLFILADQLNFF